MNDNNFLKQLEDFRAEIDIIDSEILKLLSKRFEVVTQVGELKANHGLQGSYIRPAREALMLRKLVADGEKLGLKAELIVILWRQLIGAATAHESPLNVILLASDLQASFAAEKYFGEVPSRFADMLDFWQAGDSHSIFILPYNFQCQLWQSRPQHLKVFAHIPPLVKNHQDCYLALANIQPEPTGDDVFLYQMLDGTIYESKDWKGADDYNYIGCFAKPVTIC
jgi:chorismate mutase-like protein